jgi:NodT family efflux transporter outer membrane factor (OMF) lipoprotein
MRVRALWSGCVALLLTVSGCTTWTPSVPASAPARSEIDIPPGWANAEGARTGYPKIDADSLAAWWQRFEDPLLADLVSRALLSNTSVASAQAAVRQAQALRDVAAAALLPTLVASGSAQRGRAGGDSTGNRFQLGLDGQWVPDVFGARRDARDAGNATAAASVASLGDAQVQVAAEVALNYILLRAVQARSVIATENLASQQETFQITAWRQQAGLVTTLEVEQARAAAAQTQALLPALQISMNQTAHALAVLVGQPPAALQAELRIGMRVAPASSMGTERETLPESRGDFAMSIPADTLRHRADVRSAEYQVAAALARVGQAQAQRWPSFAIGGTIGLSAISMAALTNGASVLSSLLASVSLPVFDGGAARAQVNVQQAALEQAQQVYRAAVLGALKDVENALVALRGDRLRVASLRIAAEAASNAAVLARQRYSGGLVDFQTVLETQRNQLSTQDGVVSAMADVGSDQVRLYTALGGGWVSSSTLEDDQPATR